MDTSSSPKRYVVRHVNGSMTGPVTKDALRKLAGDGVVVPDDEVAVEGGKHFLPGWRVNGLFSESQLAGYRKRASLPTESDAHSRTTLKNSPEDLTHELRTLAALRREDLITKAEYDRKKALLLGLVQPAESGDIDPIPGADDSPNGGPFQSTRPPLTVTGEGRFRFSIPYEQALQAVRRAMQDCDVKVKEFDAARGVIRGKARYGINLFGITVVAAFHSSGSDTAVEITATLTDAIDTFGATRKKVQQVSERLMDLMASPATVDHESQPASRAAVRSRPLRSLSSAPIFEEQEGPSHKGLAVTGTLLSLGGLCIGPVSIPGLILSGVAMHKMDTSTNKDGRGWAVSGVIIGLLSLVWWVLMLVGFLHNPFLNSMRGTPSNSLLGASDSSLDAWGRSLRSECLAMDEMKFNAMCDVATLFELGIEHNLHAGSDTRSNMQEAWGSLGAYFDTFKTESRPMTEENVRQLVGAIREARRSRKGY